MHNKKSKRNFFIFITSAEQSVKNNLSGSKIYYKIVKNSVRLKHIRGRGNPAPESMDKSIYLRLLTKDEMQGAKNYQL